MPWDWRSGVQYKFSGTRVEYFLRRQFCCCGGISTIEGNTSEVSIHYVSTYTGTRQSGFYSNAITYCDLQPSPAINGGPSNAELDTGSHPGVQGRRLDFVRDETENGATTSLSLSSLPRTFPCSTPASRDARCQLSTTAEEEHVSQEVPPYIVHQTPVTRLSVSQLPTPPTDVCNRITPTNKQDLDEME